MRQTEPDEQNAGLIDLIAASKTDSHAAELAKQLYIFQLQGDLKKQAEFLESDYDFGQTNYSVN